MIGFVFIPPIHVFAMSFSSRVLFLGCSLSALALGGLATAQQPAPSSRPATPPVTAAPTSAAPGPGTPAPTTTAKNGSENKIAAVVDGAVIFQSEVETEYASLPPDFKVVPYARLYPSLVNRLIDRRLLLNRGNAQGLKNDPEVRQRVASAEERAIQEVFLAREVKRYISEDTLKARYADYVKANPPQEQIRLRLILVESRAIAEEVITALRQGQDFSKLAQERSRASTGKTGGDVGYITRSSGMPETLMKAAFLLEAGQFTKTPVESPFGWNILKVEDRRTIKPGTYEEKKQEIANDITSKVVENLLASLRTGANIERYNIDGSVVELDHKPPANGAPAAPGTTGAPTSTPAPAATSPHPTVPSPAGAGAPGRPPMRP